MVNTLAASAFTTITSLSSEFNFEPRIKLCRLHNHVDTQSNKFKDNIQIPSKTSGANILKTENIEVTPLLSSSITSYNSLQDLNLGFNKFTKEVIKRTIQRNEDQDEIGTFGSNEFVQNGLAYREKLRVRSYEIGTNGTVSMETLMSHLQEVGLNHLKCAGLLGDGLGSSPEMCKRDLVWVTTKVQIVIDRYPIWGDAVQIETWIAPSGKTHMRRDSLIRDRKTGQILVKVSSKWVLMNKVTRKLCRIPEEVRDELGPYMMDAEASPILENDSKKTPKLDETTADYVFSGLKPRWGDLDINQHVNNAKYVAWILESVPSSIMKNREISQITMEYRRECHRDDVLQSLTAVSDTSDNNSAYCELVDCGHLLRLEDGSEVMKARTEWKRKDT